MPQLTEAASLSQLLQLDVDAFGDGAALQLEHLEVAGHGAGDDADARVAAVEPAPHGREVGALVLRALPLAAGRGLGAVGAGAQDGAAGDSERDCCRLCRVRSGAVEGGGGHDLPSTLGRSRPLLRLTVPGPRLKRPTAAGSSALHAHVPRAGRCAASG